MGPYQTNCYIVTTEKGDLIIDPGVDATSWVMDHVSHPLAILNTHGHFDHVWSDAELKKRLKIPVYIPEADAFMLKNDPFAQGTPPCEPDYLVKGDEALDISGIRVKYRLFPGHTPGCSIIEMEDVWFSGDFLFQQSIGRWDFPYSDAEAMAQSLEKAMKIKEDFTLYPGHGLSTTLKAEQKLMPYWIRQVRGY